MSSSCAVCTAPLTALGGALAACPSGDIFHDACIQKWIASRGYCCTCKQRYTQTQLVTLKLPAHDAAAMTQPKKPSASSPTTPSSSRSQHAAAASPPSPTLPPKGSPLSLAHVEELVASYRRTASSHAHSRAALQSALHSKLQQLQSAYSRVISESAATADAMDGAEGEDAEDEALMHRHTLMAKLLSAVHEARLRDEEDAVDEMARVVHRVAGDGSGSEDGGGEAGMAATVRGMEQLMDEVDAQCWERIRTKRRQLADMEEEMRREEHEKLQLAQRIAALHKRRQQLEDSMHATAHTRKRKEAPAAAFTPTDFTWPAHARPQQQQPQPELGRLSHMSPQQLRMAAAASDDDDDDDSEEEGAHRFRSPPLSASSSASKRRKPAAGPPLPVGPPPVQLSAEQFDALTDPQKLALPRLTILQHCPTIESFLSHALHLRTIKRTWHDNEWRRLNTTYTGQRKRKGLKGRGKGRQVLPATLEEQQVWKDVRRREMALLTGGQVDDAEAGYGAAGAGGGGGGGEYWGSSDDDSDERSVEEGNEGSGRSEKSEQNGASQVTHLDSHTEDAAMPAVSTQ